MSPRRSATPSTIGAEDRLREHVRRFMDDNDRGATWFARQVQQQGCESFTNMTLAKILNHGRVIYTDEAVAMAAVMGATLDDLVSP